MTITPEQLAAFADGELPEAEAQEIAKAVAQDADLARKVAQHRALRAQLSAHFAPIMDAPIPDRLTAALKAPQAQVIDLAAARLARASKQSPSLPDQRQASWRRWAWIAAPALAASLALVVLLPKHQDTGPAYATGPLAEALGNQLSASTPGATQTRILLSFKDGTGTYCRAFSGAAQAGIACHDERGWQLRKVLGAAAGPSNDYRQAGSADAALMAMAQDMAPDGALDAAQEQEAKARGWQK
ncbi:anti-sigma factor family protein [Novosphingobium sp.]|uniref:anti-sigma factor family protein n=1 Tax=Novosphingobium sp. TaxID=1874826 RepID=UPI003BA9E0CD